MEEFEAGKISKIRVEGNHAAAGAPGKRREISVRPKMQRKARRTAELLEFVVNAWRFVEKTNIHFAEILSINPPSLAGSQGAAEHAAVSGQAEETQHRNPAKGDEWTRLMLPISLGGGVVDVISIHQGKPDIDIGKIRHDSRGGRWSTR